MLWLLKILHIQLKSSSLIVNTIYLWETAFKWNVNSGLTGDYSSLIESCRILFLINQKKCYNSDHKYMVHLPNVGYWWGEEKPIWQKTICSVFQSIKIGDKTSSEVVKITARIQKP